MDSPRRGLLHRTGSATHWLLYAGEPFRQSLQAGTRREAASRRVAAQRAASPPRWLRNALAPKSKIQN
ncbi:hypothetical protein ACF3DV_16610 [Chlorogloeopsis fritschii PCC 9212]|uniref:hypothetical protein n=1 Tax=Chlorogloeopsis fritschii TaxID=1124 RepID=UPI0003820C72|nr:hypothetical protein [Chlorogloeopsis fritschii]